MHLTRLELIHFRNINKLSFDFHPKLTVFLGPNGSGKTNILEAISLLSLPRSFRGGRDNELIAWNESYARISGTVEFSQGSSRELVVFIEDGKKLQVDGQLVSVQEFVSQFLSVLFAPEDVSLLSGTPGGRRAFLDGHLSLLSSQYLSNVVQYQRVLTRRNKLLAQRRTTESELEFWNEQQAQYGTLVVEARQRGVGALEQFLSKDLKIDYLSQLLSDQPILIVFHEKQAALAEAERRVGHTLFGPQRDDWRLMWRQSERNLGTFGSRGEQRMGVVGLKQAQLGVINDHVGQPGVLLLDDVLSELDAANQEVLLRSMNEQQTILTTATLSDVPSSLLQDAWIYEKQTEGWVRR